MNAAMAASNGSLERPRKAAPRSEPPVRSYSVLVGLITAVARQIPPRLHLGFDYVYKLFHGVGAFPEHSLLVGSQLDLIDLLDAAGAKFHGNAYKQALDTVFSFQIRGAREHFLLVLEDGFHHLDSRRRRSV